jgi:hypothetical protein
MSSDSLLVGLALHHHGRPDLAFKTDLQLHDWLATEKEGAP